MIRVDPEATQQYGFLDTGGPGGSCRSYVRPDGRIHLFGADMSLQRHLVWERTGGFCEAKLESGQDCNRTIYEETMHLHHEKRRSRGGDDSMGNLKGICEPCHRKLHPQVQSGKVISIEGAELD
jgi:hypothetical protein